MVRLLGIPLLLVPLLCIPLRRVLRWLVPRRRRPSLPERLLRLLLILQWLLVLLRRTALKAFLLVMVSAHRGTCQGSILRARLDLQDKCACL